MNDNKNNVSPIKKGGKFNVLDLLIIIVVLFALAIAIIITIPKIQKSVEIGEKVEITYTVVFEGVNDRVYDKIKANQKAVEALSNRSLGTVKQTEIEPYSEYVIVQGTDGNGETVYTAVKQEIAEKGKNIAVTITADAVYNEGSGYTVEGYRIAVGKQIEIRFADFTGTAYCTSVTVINEG